MTDDVIKLCVAPLARSKNNSGRNWKGSELAAGPNTEVMKLLSEVGWLTSHCCVRDPRAA